MTVRHKKTALPTSGSKIHAVDWNDEHVNENGDPISYVEKAEDGSVLVTADGADSGNELNADGVNAYNNIQVTGASAGTAIRATGESAINAIQATGDTASNQTLAHGAAAYNQSTADGLDAFNRVVTNRADHEVQQFLSDASGGATARLYVSAASPVGVITPTALPAICLASGSVWFAMGLTAADWVRVGVDESYAGIRGPAVQSATMYMLTNSGSYPVNAIPVKAPLDTMTDIDPFGFADVANNQIIIPSGLDGFYHVEGRIVITDDLGIDGVAHTRLHIDSKGNFDVTNFYAGVRMDESQSVVSADVELSYGDAVWIGTSLYDAGGTNFQILGGSELLTSITVTRLGRKAFG